MLKLKILCRAFIEKLLSYKTTRHLMRFIFLTITGLSMLFHAGDSSIEESASSTTYFELAQKAWVDSVYSSLSLDQQLGQLFMVAAYSNKAEEHAQDIEKLIQDHNIGGLIFFQGGPARQAVLTNRFQKLAKVPLLLAMDAEWGLAMRLDSTMKFPKQMTLGAVQDNDLIYAMGKEIARQCKRMGMHVNFAPVVDVNVNPNNPVIGYRSFGEDKYLVAKKGVAYMKGMQDANVMANAKHFPGHGDTDKDSHYDLPLIKHSKERLDEIELYPFKELIKEGLMSTMVAHLNIPALDDRKNRPSTLSKKVVTDLLRDELGFEGIIFTDAMNMHGVSKHYKIGQANSEAIKAGNDILLFPHQVPEAIENIKLSLKNGSLVKGDIERRVKKVLGAKYWAGLHEKPEVSTENIYEELHTVEAEKLNKKLFEKAITTVKNKDDFLPIKRLEDHKVAVVSIGEQNGNVFQEVVKKYTKADAYSLTKYEKNIATYLNKLKKYDLVIVGFHDMSNSPSRNFGISQSSLDFLKKLNAQTKTITCTFGNAYALKFLTQEDHLICAYEENKYTLSLVPQIIFGAIGCSGKLPISIGDKIPFGTGKELKSLGRLGYDTPEDVGLNSDDFLPIDTIAAWAIKDNMTPGCQVLVAKNNKVIFNKAYGYFTYDKKNAVTTSSVYDLASITKVLGTLQAIMYLYEQEELDLEEKLSTYLPKAKSTNKENLRLKDMLTHQSGLKPYVPFWYVNTIATDSMKKKFYTEDFSLDNPIRVSKSFYATRDIEDSLITWTLATDLLSKKRKSSHDYPYPYKYSDMGYHLLKRAIEDKIDEPIEKFLTTHFYSPLGMGSTNYKPLGKGFSLADIPPTEEDTLYRKARVQGTVHDQVAAMIGGVGGHAGLFSSATDLCKILQMFVNKGKYGGKRYFKEETIQLFTSKQNDYSRRGLGWDKTEGSGLGPSSEMSSLNSFGHSGFTGTLVWVDPDYDLIYIFLSNRTYPDATNNSLLRNDIRTRVQDVVYEALLKAKRREQERAKAK